MRKRGYAPIVAEWSPESAVGPKPLCGPPYHANASRKAAYWDGVGNAHRLKWKDHQLLLGGDILQSMWL